jgi:transposase
VGSLTALAFVLIIGRAERFQCGKQIASYLGLVPSEESSGDRRRLGHISKGRTEFQNLNTDLRASFGWTWHIFNESEMAHSSECTD